MSDEDAPANPVDPTILLQGEIESLGRFEQAVFDVAKGGVDRSRNAASSVVAASTAIGTIYTGLLAFAFGAGSVALPLRGVIAPLFLAASVILATAYLAYLAGRLEESTTVSAGSGLNARTRARMAAFSSWTGALVTRRARALRAAVLALAVGLVALPLPFLQLPGDGTPSARPIVWPSPDPLLPSDLQALRYQAELDAAVEHAADQPPIDQVAWLQLIISGAFVTVGAGVVLLGSRRNP